MKYNILRVSTFPTIEKSGMGLHPAKLCGIKGFDTFYLMPYENSSRLFYPENTQLVEKSFIPFTTFISSILSSALYA